MKKVNLKRQVSSIEVSDPSAQAAIDNALAALAKSGADGQDEAVAVVKGVMTKTPEVVDTKPVYGGIFRGKMLKGSPLTQADA